MCNDIYGYNFFEGDKGVVIASSIEEVEDKVKDAYGEDYCNNHSLYITLLQYIGSDVLWFPNLYL